MTTRTTSNDMYAWGGHGSGSAASPADGLNRLASFAGTTLSYDAKGNLTSDGSNSYVYTSENRLASLTNPGNWSTAMTLKYDPLGRLQQLGSNYSGYWAEVLEDEAGQVVAEYMTQSRARRYVFGPGDDEVLVQYFTSPTFNSRTWYLQDERQSVIASGNDGGGYSNPNRYGDYGELQSTNNGRFQYTGQYWLAEPSLLYYKNRFYDPKLGRFLQTDPIGYGAGMNMYAYVGGDPVNATDPWGLNPKTENPKPPNCVGDLCTTTGSRIPSPGGFICASCSGTSSLALTGAAERQGDSWIVPGVYLISEYDVNNLSTPTKTWLELRDTGGLVLASLALNTDIQYGAYLGSHPKFCGRSRVCTDAPGGVYGAFSDYSDIARDAGVTPSPPQTRGVGMFGLSISYLEALTRVPTGVITLRVYPSINFYGAMSQARAVIDVPAGVYAGQIYKIGIHYYGKGVAPF
jgi:RHS repeat-associated protein